MAAQAAAAAQAGAAAQAAAATASEAAAAGEGTVHRRGCECRQLHAELVSSTQYAVRSTQSSKQ